MLNLMIIEGYVNAEPELINNPKDDTKYLVKFRVATKNGFASEKSTAWIWVNVVCFCNQERADFIMKNIAKDDYVTVVGEYSYMRSGNRYYPQLVLNKIDKKWSKGEAPSLAEAVNIEDNPNDKKEMNW